MGWSDEVRIETPEQIDVGLELAGLGSRFVGQLFDWTIKILATVFLIIIGIVVAGLMGASLDVNHTTAYTFALLIGVGYLLWFGYDLFFEASRNGQTPGKRTAGIRVIRDGGAPLDFRAAAIRNLLGLADMLPGFYVLGAIIIIVTPKRQRLGDLAAGTIVVRERVVAPPAETEAAIQDYSDPEYTFTASQLAACAPNDRHILRSFLRRQAKMQRTPRDRLARRLARTFAEKMSYDSPRPLNDGWEATVFLASLLRDLTENDRRGQ